MSAAPAARLALLIDTERCTGCKSCEAACKQEHRLGPGEYRNRVLWLGDDDRPGLSFLTLACQHCERPACLRACPVNPKAIEKDPDTGVVRVNEDRCTGCGECVIACPYSAMGYDARGHHAVKCDLCDGPPRCAAQTTACASVCPTRAIRFGEREALIAEAQAEGRTLRDNDDFLLGPATVYLERIGAAASPATPRRPAFMDAPLAQAVMQRQRRRHFPTARRAKRRRPTASCRAAATSASTAAARPSTSAASAWCASPATTTTRCCRAASARSLSSPCSSTTARTACAIRKSASARAAKGASSAFPGTQALDEIAERLKAVRAAHGPEALALFIGTRTGMLDCLGTTRLFAQLWGTPNHETTDPFCASSKNVAFELTQGRVGSGNSYTETDIGSAQLYVYIGDNQAETRPVYFGLVNDWRLQHGAKMVVVDPRLTVTASKADRWLAIRPGTDMALGLALAHHILDRQPARPALLQRVAARLRRMARLHPRARVLAGVGGADHRHRRRRDPAPRRRRSPPPTAASSSPAAASTSIPTAPRPTAC